MDESWFEYINLMLLDESVTPGYTTVFEVLGLPRWFPPPRRNAVKFSSPGAACHAGGNNAVQPDKKLKKDALETYGMYDVERIKYQAVRHWLGTSGYFSSIFQHLSAPKHGRSPTARTRCPPSVNAWVLMTLRHHCGHRGPSIALQWLVNGVSQFMASENPW